jgi:hypothetical protein
MLLSGRKTVAQMVGEETVVGYTCESAKGYILPPVQLSESPMQDPSQREHYSHYEALLSKLRSGWQVGHRK